MPRQFDRTFLRDDLETEVTVTFSFTPGTDASGQWGPPEHYDPGSGPEIDIDAVRPDPDPDKSAHDIELTEPEVERFKGASPYGSPSRLSPIGWKRRSIIALLARVDPMHRFQPVAGNDPLNPYPCLSLFRIAGNYYLPAPSFYQPPHIGLALGFGRRFAPH